MLPIWIVLGAFVVFLLYWMVGGLAEPVRKRLGRVLPLVVAVTVLALLVRTGQVRLAALGAIAMAVFRLHGPILLRLMPLLLSLLGRSKPGGHEPGEPSTRAPSSQMSRAEALEVLGLAEGASADEVRAAYAALIKKVHPDHGGSAYLAARVNLARDLLLGKHA